MAEYISRENVLDNSNIITVQTREYGSIEVIPVDTIADIELADVQPVVHAYWIKLSKALNPNENPCKCSNCGHILSSMNSYPKSKYCDECGAKMDVVYEDDKIRAIKVTGWGDGTRNLTDEETNIYNNRLETEAKTIDEISLL